MTRAAQHAGDAIALRRVAIGVLGYPKHAAALLVAPGANYWQLRLRSADSVAPLVAALGNSISDLRMEAALVFGGVGAAALPALELAADDADPEVRKSARLAIMQMGKAGHGA